MLHALRRLVLLALAAPAAVLGGAAVAATAGGAVLVPLAPAVHAVNSLAGWAGPSLLLAGAIGTLLAVAPTARARAFALPDAPGLRLAVTPATVRRLLGHEATRAGGRLRSSAIQLADGGWVLRVVVAFEPGPSLRDRARAAGDAMREALTAHTGAPVADLQLRADIVQRRASRAVW